MAIFNTTEKRREGIESLDKWSGCLERHRAEQERFGNGRASESYNAWMAAIADQVGRPRNLLQLEAVNRLVNAGMTYVGDQRNRGERDHWQSPGQSLRTGRGDCEDYAILKFLTLRMLGWADLRIVVLRTLGEAHAVCVAYHNGMMPPRWLVLDNLTTLVHEDRKLRRYKPSFSMDETGWWRHRRRAA